MTVWLPTAEAEAFTDEALTEFLQAAHPESNTHDYKVGAAVTIPKAVSAFANTHGGIVIVGVPDAWTGNLDDLLDIDPATEDRIVNTLVDVLDPPYLPQVLRHTVAGKHLMVLRIDPATAPRPLFASATAYLRRERRSVNASAQDLRNLFEHNPPPAIHQPLPLNRPVGDLSELNRLTDSTNIDFGVRVGGGLGVFHGDLTATKLLMPLRRGVLAALTITRATEWASAFAHRHELDVGQWTLHRPSYPTVASFLLELHTRPPRQREPRGGVHVQIDLNGPGSVGGGGVAVTTTIALAVTATREDDALRKRGSIPQGELHLFSPHIGPEDLGFMFDMAIDTTDRISSVVERMLLDGPAARHTPPGGSMGGLLDDVCAFDDLPYLRPDPHPLASQHIFQPPAAAPSDEPARAAVINDWLETLVMALGYLPDGDIWS